MASQTKIQPPFAWLGRHTSPASVICAVGLGALFRFYLLPSLPPGLDASSAAIGLQALDLTGHGWLPGLNAVNGYAPLWVWLQALPVKLLGHTALALYLWPAIVGTLSVLTTWLWARSWFGLRLAWLTALLLAVTPWAVTLSRTAVPAALMPLLVTLTLWLATRAWRQPSVSNSLFFAGAILLDLLSGPVGWLIALSVLVARLILLFSRRRALKFNRPHVVGLVGLGVAIGSLTYLMVVSLDAVKHLPSAAGLTTDPAALGSNLVKTLLMFNIFGDENWRHNLSGEPMLNAFVGLMLIAGVLVGVSRLNELRYRATLAFTFVLLLPAVVTTVGVPNAARAAAALPLVLLLAAVGVSYMLELWYRTFPINSAARAAGQAAIIVLMALSIFQGYTQYFKAWAGSAQVYAVYNEGAVKIADHLQKDKFAGQRFVVASADEQKVVAYLDYNQTQYQAISAKDIAALPITPGPRQFHISAGERPDAVKNLKLKFPGGVLRPLLSEFNRSEICYVYEVTK